MSSIKLKSAFDAVVETYDQSAELQHKVAHQLIKNWIVSCQRSSWIDLGAGTGAVSLLLEKNNQLQCALDLSFQMCRKIYQKNKISVINADIENLPFAHSSIQNIVSSFALHWCNPLKAIKEISRINTEKGYFIAAIPIAGSLEELINAGQESKLMPNLYGFPSQQEWFNALSLADFNVQRFEISYEKLECESVKDLRNLFRSMGGHVARISGAGLIGKYQWQKFLQAMEQFRHPTGQLRLYYKVLWICAQRCPI
ncbi:MAG: methyltransferase domain-containing protein [Pseudomonadota bacterium]